MPEDVENDFEVLGATAMEDLLQDDAPQCVRDFKEADISVWMLTGDKGETARQIAYTCGIFDEGMKQALKVTEEHSSSGGLTMNEGIKEGERYGITISGTSLVAQLQDP